ncbi:DUF3379 family protein [Pseudomonadota bacterium]
MNFSEFKRLLGAEPRNSDPEFRRICHSSPEFEQEAREAAIFEEKLERAMALPEPGGLVENLVQISEQAPARSGSRRLIKFALAASLFVAVGAAGIVWKMNPGWTSVEDYLVDHYRHDGISLLTRADGSSAEDVQKLLAELDIQASPALADIVGVIKYCPTPDGKGIHMILNTKTGPVTVFYMPDTKVNDREILAFDDVEAVLVELQSGSAAIIGPNTEELSSLQAIIYDSLLPLPGNS